MDLWVMWRDRGMDVFTNEEMDAYVDVCRCGEGVEGG